MNPPNLPPDTWLKVEYEDNSVLVIQLKDVTWGEPMGMVWVTDYEHFDDGVQRQ